MRRLIACLLASVLPIASCTPPADSEESTREQRAEEGLAVTLIGGIPVIAGRALVKFPGPLPDESWTKFLLPGLTAPTEVIRFPDLGVIVIETRAIDTARFLNLLRKTERFTYVEPDYVILKTATVPRDGFFRDGTLWGLNNIDAPMAWKCSIGSDSIVVAVVDGGIETAHFELKPNRWEAPAAFTVTIDGSPLPCKKGGLGYDAVD